MTPWITISVAAERAGVCSRLAYEWARDGRLRVIKIGIVQALGRDEPGADLAIAAERLSVEAGMAKAAGLTLDSETLTRLREARERLEDYLVADERRAQQLGTERPDGDWTWAVP